MRGLIHGASWCALLACSSAASADILFHFQQVGNDVTMTSSGTFDTTGLNIVGPFGWGLSGIEENGNHDIMGGTDVGQVDISFAFNAGTDFSQWASANGPWSASDFTTTVNSGVRGFTTYVRDPNNFTQIPGLGVERLDMNGALWSPDQNWTWTNRTIANLSMNPGSYSVSDSVTGEKITFLIGPIPAPASLAVLGIALGLGRSRRRSA